MVFYPDCNNSNIYPRLLDIFYNLNKYIKNNINWNNKCIKKNKQLKYIFILNYV